MSDTFVESLTSLIRRFVEDRITGGVFATSYQREYVTQLPPDDATFVILDRLFFVCEDYYDDVDLRDPGDTTDEELLAAAVRALRELDERRS